jgi:hypothetical protein
MARKPKVDMTKGNKHEPKIRGAVKQPDPHAGHGHKGTKKTP